MEEGRLKSVGRSTVHLLRGTRTGVYRSRANDVLQCTRYSEERELLHCEKARRTWQKQLSGMPRLAAHFLIAGMHAL